MNSIKKFRIAAKLLTLLCALLTTACASQDAADSTAPKKQNYDIAAYYWPAYHPEPRWAELGVFGDGKGEWQNVYEAKPKHKGHDQPRVPLLGYEDESDPAVMAKKIDIATSHGVNVMIFDWYWFEDKPFLENALDRGFLGAPNSEKMKFFLMWANHDVNLTWNNKVAKKSEKVFWRGGVSYEVFTHIADRVVAKYFKQPNYYKIDGKPVFSIYEINTFIKGIGGVENAKKALNYLRKKRTKRARAYISRRWRGICRAA